MCWLHLRSTSIYCRNPNIGTRVKNQLITTSSRTTVCKATTRSLWTVFDTCINQMIIIVLITAARIAIAYFSFFSLTHNIPLLSRYTSLVVKNNFRWMISFGGWNFVDNLCNNGPSIKKLKNYLMKTKKKTFLDNPLLFLLQNRCYLEIWKRNSDWSGFLRLFHH